MKKFSPLLFLSSLGAGGIAIIPFAFLQYTFPHGGGLIKLADILSASLSLPQDLLMYLLYAVMIVFTILHVVMSIIFFKRLVPFVRNEEYKEFIGNPLKNSGIMAPFISIIMTMNVFIGPVRFFIPEVADNLQNFMLPALLFWVFLFILLLKTEIKLLKTAFVKGFDINKITFGWLLHPFALAMLTVTGTGIAAIAKDANIAHVAVFMSFISGTMGMFLLFVKIISVFQKHFADDGLGEKHFLPSFLIVIPSVTLYAISLFRVGHYLEKQHHFHLDSFFLLVMVSAFAFEVWYFLFGLSLLKDYFSKHHFNREYYVTQWGLICPVVAFAVLGSFVYSSFVASPIIYWVIIIFMLIAVVLFFDLLIRSIRCTKGSSQKISCE